ncbi:hypothetical protein WMY93_028413 [Mugilogobius chulae]|uniref:Uncharacterized protein n=1 Tax=Mugilogobius chulae TaxID=88201 RepID=A0AAW0MSC4_9GOBI
MLTENVQRVQIPSNLVRADLCPFCSRLHTAHDQCSEKLLKTDRQLSLKQIPKPMEAPLDGCVGAGGDRGGACFMSAPTHSSHDGESTKINKSPHTYLLETAHKRAAAVTRCNTTS